MNCKNCGAEIIGDECGTCGWKIGEPPENKENLVKLLTWIADEYEKANQALEKNENDCHAEIEELNDEYVFNTEDIQELQEEKNKRIKEREAIKDRHKGGCLLGLCIVTFLPYEIYSWFGKGLGFFEMLTNTVLAFILAFILDAAVLNYQKKRDKEVDERYIQEKNDEIKEIDEQIAELQEDNNAIRAEKDEEIKELQEKLQDKQKAVQEDIQDRVAPYDFLPNGIDHIHACREMVQYLNDRQANDYMGALNVYDRKMSEAKMRQDFENKLEAVRQEAEVARVNAYNAGQQAGYKKGYKKGYNQGQSVGADSGYEWGYYDGKRSR